MVSTSICNECVLNINNFYTFKKRVLDAQDLINSAPISIEQQNNDSSDCVEEVSDVSDEYHNDEEFELEDDDDDDDDEDDDDEGVEYPDIENIYMDENNDDHSSHNAQIHIIENTQETSMQPIIRSVVPVIVSKRPNNSTDASVLPSAPKKIRKNAQLSAQSSSEQFTLQINECLICPAVLEDILQLKDHIDAHQLIQCKACHRQFVRYSNLKRHFNAVHSKPKPFTCHFCGLGFNFEVNLQSHIALHSSGKIQNNM